MTDKALKKLGMFVLFAVAVLLTIDHFTSDDSVPTQSAPASSGAVPGSDYSTGAATPKPVIPCGTVSTKCVAKVTLDSPDCQREQAIEEANKHLAKPLQSFSCQNVTYELDSSCPSNCTFDASSMFTVPGQAEYDFSVQSGGNCRITATKPVNFSGRCTSQ